MDAFILRIHRVITAAISILYISNSPLTIFPKWHSGKSYCTQGYLRLYLQMNRSLDWMYIFNGTIPTVLLKGSFESNSKNFWQSLLLPPCLLRQTTFLLSECDFNTFFQSYASVTNQWVYLFMDHYTIILQYLNCLKYFNKGKHLIKENNTFFYLYKLHISLAKSL